MWCICVWNMYTHVLRCQMRTSDVLFYYSLFYSLKAGLSVNLKLVLQPPSPSKMISYLLTTHINPHTQCCGYRRAATPIF